jgi:hypothetical protein
MIAKFSFVFLLWLALCSAAGAQSVPPPSDLSSKAVVYFYSLSAGPTLGRVKKAVYLDDKPIAEIRPERFFIVLVEPGRHSFHLKNKKLGGVEMEFEAGKTYYLRMKWESDGILRPAGVERVEEDNGRFDVKNLKPVGKKNVINRNLVFLELEN